MKKIIIMVVCALGLSGCVSSKLNQLETGMRKKEVIEIMGNPYKTSAHNNYEYMSYHLYNPDLSYSDYFVRLVNGKVDSYGLVGDFDSTRVPESKHTIIYK